MVYHSGHGVAGRSLMLRSNIGLSNSDILMKDQRRLICRIRVARWRICATFNQDMSTYSVDLAMMCVLGMLLQTGCLGFI